MPEMRASYKEDCARHERLCSFLRNCWRNNLCRHYISIGIVNYMRGRFRYILDPIFLFSLALYAGNKLSHLPSKLFGHYFCSSYLRGCAKITLHF